MTENGLFVRGGPEMQLHDILWATHDGKNVVEERARKISASSRLKDCGCRLEGGVNRRFKIVKV